MLLDFDPTVRMFPDGVIDDGLRTVLQMGKVPGYSLSVDLGSITPDIQTAKDYALITYHTAKLFLQGRPDRYSFKTRGFSESFGSYVRALMEVEQEIHNLENGDAFSAWQSYFAWLHGVAGLPLGEVLAQFDLEAPLWRATFTRDGMRVA